MPHEKSIHYNIARSVPLVSRKDSTLPECTGPVWVYNAKANGKSKSDALKAKMRAAISSNWSYIYTVSEKLSN